MNNGFLTKPLQSLCDNFKQDIVDGPFGSELKREDYITEGIPVLKIQNVKPFAIELKKMDYVSAEKFNELRRHSFRRGDIVMTKLGSPLGVSAIVEDLEEGVIVADLVRVRAQQINTKYLCYHLNSQRTNDFINSMQKGTTRPRVTLSVVRELPIYAPPLAEQQRIVSLLDEAFAGLAKAKENAEKNLQNARALFESHLEFVFTQRGPGWVEKPLGNVFTTVTGTTPPKNNTAFYGDFMPLVKPPELSDEPLDSAPDGLSEKGAAVARTLPPKSILVSCIGNLGKIGLNTVPVAFNQQINAILPNDSQAIPEFMFFQSLSPVFKSQLDSLASGTTVPIVNKSKFNSVSVVLPPLRVQKPVVAQLSSFREKTQRLARLYEQKLEALETLKKSILHEAFSGNL